ncbi:MAG: antibiotic ABC transporter ATP-binding protein [Cryomorphaceae bacterium MED-G14]|nr:MAG: antibiotic ABC transporter ATP-binding protein [Cryomorphaceae bacterium MED-G14]|tara:strand:+ start:9262 stop:11028 length:1767 start_codon:yes stop_codon:yes gene_type:complete
MSENKKFNIKLFRRLLKYVYPYKINFIFLITAAISISVFSIVNQYLLKIAVDKYITPKDYEGLIFIISLMFGVLLFKVSFQFLFVFLANILGQKVVYDIRIKLFRRIISFKMSYYDRSSVGRLVTRSVNDMETIASIFSQGLFMIISDLLLMFSVLVVMLILSIKLSLIIFLILPFILIATRLFQRAMKTAFNQVRNEVANLNSFVQERISGMKEIQIFNRESIEKSNFIKINEKHKNAWLKTVWYNSIFFPVAEISTSITIGLLVWYGGGLVGFSDSSITIGTIFLFIQLSQMLFRPLRQIADKFNTLQMGMVAANRIFNILDTNDFISDTGNLKLKKINGNVIFKNVDFSYEPKNSVFKKFNLTIKSGEKIAIVGSTGSGKTTIINLLLRFYEINGGDILIDGKSIRELSIKFLRSQISLVTQNIFLFADSIYNNIVLYNKNINKANVISAAKEIGVHNFVKKLPGSYNYNVKERGVMLSEGQKQLISFLRAYISDSNILILDEATSSIDTKTEKLIQFAISKIIQNKTSIIIAHRLSTILNSDKIIVLDKGEIKEMGSHDDLMKIKDGHYKKLFELQYQKTELVS